MYLYEVMLVLFIVYLISSVISVIDASMLFILFYAPRL